MTITANDDTTGVFSFTANSLNHQLLETQGTTTSNNGNIHTHTHTHTYTHMHTHTYIHIHTSPTHMYALLLLLLLFTVAVLRVVRTRGLFGSVSVPYEVVAVSPSGATSSDLSSQRGALVFLPSETLQVNTHTHTWTYIPGQHMHTCTYTPGQHMHTWTYTPGQHTHTWTYTPGLHTHTCTCTHGQHITHGHTCTMVDASLACYTQASS